MPFVFVKSINAYKSTLFWKNLTITKTYVILYPILVAILKKNGLFQPKYLIWIPGLIIFDKCVPIGNRKNTIYNDLKKVYYWLTPSVHIRNKMQFQQ